jgi:hypothetical protein
MNSPLNKDLHLKVTLRLRGYSQKTSLNFQTQPYNSKIFPWNVIQTELKPKDVLCERSLEKCRKKLDRIIG